MTGRAHSIAFVAPRLAEGSVVGGAETLLRNLARHTAAAGYTVTFLTTCAVNHFTWANERPPGPRRAEGLDVIAFPVDTDRDIAAFLDVQTRICHGATVSRADEETWLRNNVNSRALMAHLREAGDRYDLFVMGPYLFGLIYYAAGLRPERTLLTPCLHDEPFARLQAMRELFRSVRGCLFNTDPERDLAERLYDLATPDATRPTPPIRAVVGMGLDPVAPDPRAFARERGLAAPYIIYSGRREPLKGTPLLIDFWSAYRARTGRDVKLVLTGGGQVDLPPEAAPHVLDAGFLSERDKFNAMAGATAFCHPSVNESLGIVLLEAWLAGTPALVHACGNVLAWQCRRANGGLWFRTYPEFEEALTRLLDDPVLRDRMGAAGREYVRREYAWPAVEARLKAALDQASASPTISEIASSAR